jgi:hypothetical protein
MNPPYAELTRLSKKYSRRSDEIEDLVQDLLLEAGEAAEFDTRVPHWIGNPAEAAPAEVIAIFGTQGERIHLHGA